MSFSPMGRAERSALFWERLPLVALPPAELRRPLANAWLAAARNEHASVASFSEFSLSLLALGAPASLLEECHRAALEEIEHARICFAVASHFSGEELGPGPLPIPATPPEVEPERVLKQTIVDGCLGEALAAAEAARAAELCESEVLRAALETIALDEARHAELAWSFVGWLLVERPDLRGIALATFDEQLSLAEEPLGVSVYENFLAGYGRLPAEERSRARRATVEAYIAPALRELRIPSTLGAE